jgi:hypothetical protein
VYGPRRVQNDVAAIVFKATFEGLIAALVLVNIVKA